MGSFLQRRGFNWEVARDVIDRIWKELEEARVPARAAHEERWEA